MAVYKIRKSDVVSKFVKLAMDEQFMDLGIIANSTEPYSETHTTVDTYALSEELSHWVRTYGEPIHDEPAPDGNRLSGCTLNTDAAKAGAGFASWLHKTVQPVKFEVGETFFGVDREQKQTLNGTQTITSIDRAVCSPLEDKIKSYRVISLNNPHGYARLTENYDGSGDAILVTNTPEIRRRFYAEIKSRPAKLANQSSMMQYYVPVPSQEYCDMFSVSDAAGRAELDNAWKHTDAGGMTFRLDARLLTKPLLKTWISGFDPDWMFAIPKPPDTEPGLGNDAPTTSNHTSKHSGCSCAECKAFNEYGEPNQPNGQYVCYACRENLAWKYR